MAALEENYSIYALFFRKEVHLRHLRTFLHWYYTISRSMQQHEIQ
mgnify:FL=1